MVLWSSEYNESERNTFLCQCSGINARAPNVNTACACKIETKPKWGPITTKQHERMKLEVNALDQLNARESTGDKSASGFSFKSDWLNKWCDFFNPITELIKANLPACFRHLIGCIYSTIIGYVRTGSAQKRLTIKKVGDSWVFLCCSPTNRTPWAG